MLRDVMTTTGGAVFSTASLARVGATMPPLALALDSVWEMTAWTTRASSSFGGECDELLEGLA